MQKAANTVWAAKSSIVGYIVHYIETFVLNRKNTAKCIFYVTSQKQVSS